jgi:CD2 antigen cytoplasmic tail-binding protein 2
MAYNAPRNKRAAEDYIRTHDSDDYSQSAKKPRFDVRNPSALAPDALEDDAILAADVIGARGQQVKRGAVNIDGYDSDSDNDNFDARADRKAKAQAETDKEASRAAEENDMFADLEEDFEDVDDSGSDKGRKSRKKRAVRFIDSEDIEGQVQSSKSGGHVSADFSLNGHRNGKARAEDHKDDSSSDSEADDETRADAGELDPELGAGSKKSNAPKLDAFNMRTEQEEGRFDDQGNYVRKAADPDAIHDIWLEGMSKKDMKKAKDAAEKREEARRKRDREDDAKSFGDVLGELIPLLERGETILEALARLGKGKDKKAKWQIKNKNKNRNGAPVDHVANVDDAAEQARKQTVEAITGAADFLLMKGQAEVYDTERELLIRQYRRETGQDWIGPPQPDDNDALHGDSNQMWEYRWTDARDGGKVNGPYDGNTMKQWNDAGYFGEGVEFRRKVAGADWTRIAEFLA